MKTLTGWIIVAWLVVVAIGGGLWLVGRAIDAPVASPAAISDGTW